ncbi:MAG: Maltose/maltodextrin ABC transporter, permease protein MalG [uncultured Thermomicrobiales bacterium]|uniref:Maltose/maltodextrin ABC transporter, permease protein MalG n=1 Tax=uncultured Thermomicrobiales bacterium TaxID=1645740 RepID=A0A6J4U215_9BACT|nr:MAG: Maltose/maltodextrin ABC transporter, permease protein MalG [uncultured Thermomicrobiales bacterium]
MNASSATVSRTLVGRVLWYLPVGLIVLFFAFPLIWMVMTALKQPVDVFSSPPKFVFAPTLDNYKRVLSSDYMGTVGNSIVVAVVSAAFSIVLGTLTAYGFSRYTLRGQDNLLFWILSLRMLPVIAVIFPYFLLFQRIGLTDTLLALMLVYSIFNISFTVWLLKGFFDEVPREMEEAAKMDGYGPWGVFQRVALPLVVPGIATAAVFNIVQSVNEFLLAFVLTQREATTAPVALLNFLTPLGLDWGGISAASTMLVLPVAVFAVLVRKHLIRGMSFGQLE